MSGLRRDATRARELLEAGEFERVVRGGIGRVTGPVADDYRAGQGLAELTAKENRTARAVADALRLVADDAFTPGQRAFLSAVEKRRQTLANDDTPVEYDLHGPSDEGLTDEVYEGRHREVRISDFPGAKPEYGPLLFALSLHLDPETVLELGTCLGISGAYIAGGLRNRNRLLTVEAGEPQVTTARETFEELGVTNRVTVRNELFQDVLFEDDGPRFEMAFLDGHHNGEATLEYFDRLYDLAEPSSVIVFDDVIGYSEGMAEAWERIARDDRVDASIVTERYGIALLKTGLDRKLDLTIPV